jgi:hypothetical protein
MSRWQKYSHQETHPLSLLRVIPDEITADWREQADFQGPGATSIEAGGEQSE